MAIPYHNEEHNTNVRVGKKRDWGSPNLLIGFAVSKSEIPIESKLLELAAGIVASYVEHNKLSSNDIPNLIKSVHAALSGTTAPEAPRRRAERQGHARPKSANQFSLTSW